MKDGKQLTLGIETSCDESAAAVVADGRAICSNVIASQIRIHEAYGGVVPEIASRRHLENINGVVQRALDDAGIAPEDLDLIGVTKGPGLIGAVLVGVATAKALSFAWDVPLVGVNHMHGHVSANFLQSPDLEPPFTALVVSGGHTNLIRVHDYGVIDVLGGTRDDAAGEAYDKVARVIGLGYPGGPKIDRAARDGDPDAVHFRRVLLEKDSFDFSFSGLKTQVLNYVNQEQMKGAPPRTEDIAASFQAAVVDVITEKTMACVEQVGGPLVMAGGVAANSELRRAISGACEEAGVKLYMPEPGLCTDNGAMIASAAYYQFLKHGADGPDLDAYANLPY